MTAPLCILVKGFPRISETFITRELEALQDSGVSFSIASLRRPTSEAKMIDHRVRTLTNYLPEYLHEEPVRVARGLKRARRFAGFANAWQMFRADLAKDVSRNRIRRFGQACVLAVELHENVRHLHAHFIHTPASVARYAAEMRGITFSVSAHAKDIWTTPAWDLADKLVGARFVCACNIAGANRLSSLAPPGTVKTWPHLVGDTRPFARLDRQLGAPLRLLTVARAVPKKGLRILIDALALLPPDIDWTWTHIGGGPLLAEIKGSIHNHPYKDRISFRGSQPHAHVLDALREHDVFVLAAIEADDGDRDGRPNALIEAMSAGLACVASPVGGVPELLDGGAGILAPPDPKGFSDALSLMLSKPEMSLALGLAAQSRAELLRGAGATAFSELTTALREASGQ